MAKGMQRNSESRLKEQAITKFGQVEMKNNELSN